MTKRRKALLYPPPRDDSFSSKLSALPFIEILANIRQRIVDSVHSKFDQMSSASANANYGELRSPMLGAREPFIASELVIFEYRPTKERVQITVVPAGG